MEWQNPTNKDAIFYGSWLKWFYDGCMFCDIQIYLKFSMYSTHVCRDTRLLNYGYISTCNWSCTPRERLLQIVWFFEVFDWVYCFFGNRRYLNKECFFHSWYMVFLATGTSWRVPGNYRITAMSNRRFLKWNGPNKTMMDSTGEAKKMAGNFTSGISSYFRVLSCCFLCPCWHL